MSGDFINERIDLCARYGTSYGEGFSVSHVTDVGGTEHSRIFNPYPKLTYELNFSNGNKDGLAKRVSDLFKRAMGTYSYFRVKHYAEFTTNQRTEPPTPNDQLCTIIAAPSIDNEWVYQIVVWYRNPGPIFPLRIITKPVLNTVRVAVNGIEVTTGFYVDYMRGRIHFLADPGGTVSAGAEFDIPMRFAADYSGVFNNLDVISATVSLIEELDGSR